MNDTQKRIKVHSHSIVDLLPAVILALFAFCILFVIASGTGVYKRIVSGSEEVTQQVEPVRYLSTAFNYAESPSSIDLVTVDGTITAKIYSAEDETDTYIYCRDGWITELYISAGDKPQLWGGQPVAEAADLDFHIDGSALIADITFDDGSSSEFIYSLAGKEGGSI